MFCNLCINDHLETEDCDGKLRCPNCREEISDPQYKLIQAAPDLLATLKSVLKSLEYHLDDACRDHNVSHRDRLCPCNRNEVAAAKAAIAAAEGKE